MPPVVRFGIALYSPLAYGEGRHWALVVGRPGHNTLDGKVNVFQIIHDSHGGYRTFHKLIDDNDGAQLSSSSRYYGVVDLGSLRADIDHVLSILEEAPAGQERYPIPYGKVWSCAWWVIRALRRLHQAGYRLWLPSDDLELYNKVVGPLATAMVFTGGLHHVTML